MSTLDDLAVTMGDNCPECGCDGDPIGMPDEDGLQEYRCVECGHYYVDDAEGDDG